MSSDELFGGRRVVLVAVPGAFTPTCHAKHLPGFIRNADQLKAAGADTVACVSTNDIFVLDAWARELGAKGKILMLADGNGDFTRAIGMERDSTPFGMGKRSQRYAMIVDDGMVTALHVETERGVVKESSAETLLETLRESQMKATG